MRFLLIIFAVSSGLITNGFANLYDARFQGHTENLRYDVWMRFKPAPPMPNYPDAPKYWTVFDTLRVIINGREIKVPRAALDSLFWPHPSGAPYPAPDNTLRIPVSGSSGEYSYEAVLVFSKSRFVHVERRDHASNKWKINKYGAR
jgi:hypothetical protein